MTMKNAQRLRGKNRDGEKREFEQGRLEKYFFKILELINLRLPSEHRKVISITAAQEKAGTSTFSRWLAIRLARIKGNKVLYVDGNIQKMGSQKNITSENLLGVLHGRSSIKSAVVTSGSGAPDIMNSGSLGVHIAGELSESTINTIYDQMREQYDYVIVDTLPVDESPFGILLSKSADGTFFVIESRKTDKVVAKRALDILSGVGCNVIGVLLNKVE